LTQCALGSAAAEQQEAEWILAKDQQGVRIYTREVAGVDFKAFKGVTTLKTSLASLVALVMDAEASPQWIKNCSESEVLERIHRHETYTYSLSEAPWPVKDRDSIIHNVVSQAQGSRVVTIKQTGKPDYIKAKKNIIRVKQIKSIWTFTPQPDGQVEVVYQSLSDPGGAIPAWLVNSMLVSQPYETLLKMRRMVQQEKYQRAELDFIVEKEGPSP
jgi:hypothetical protein